MTRFDLDIERVEDLEAEIRAVLQKFTPEEQLTRLYHIIATSRAMVHTEVMGNRILCAKYWKLVANLGLFLTCKPKSKVRRLAYGLAMILWHWACKGVASNSGECYAIDTRAEERAKIV